MTENAKDRTFETAELPEYRVEAYVAEIPVPEYMESCVDIPTFWVIARLAQAMEKPGPVRLLIFRFRISG
ncbi:MAG: hypothetical protein EUB_01933 [Eubacterium sp.]|uniref:hypothetical protein n=1 Tax=Eubacterium sp. TaxID=142586 RepID=UPI003047CDF7